MSLIYYTFLQKAPVQDQGALQGFNLENASIIWLVRCIVQIQRQACFFALFASKGDWYVARPFAEGFFNSDAMSFYNLNNTDRKIVPYGAPSFFMAFEVYS